MKRLAFLFVLSAAAVFALAVGNLAHADAPVWQVQLTSTDGGGATQTASLSTNTHYSIQCETPACFKTGTSTVAPDCTKDYELPGTKTDKAYAQVVSPPAAYKFMTGGHSKIAAIAVDAGNPKCDVYQLLQNR